MTSLIPFGHPLHGAELRLARARQLLGTLHRQYQRWADEHQTAPLRTDVDKPNQRVFVLPTVSEKKDKYLPRISITIGETAYNIRSALDYFIYSIARANNYGREVTGTQFPMEDSEDRYWARWTGKDGDGKSVPRFLNKVPKGVAEDLLHYQPCSGCKWSALLRELSNPDKHRHLTTLNTSVTFRPHGLGLGIMNADLEAETIHFQGHVEVSVFLETGEDVIDALDLVQRESRSLVRSYAGRFKFPGPSFI